MWRRNAAGVSKSLIVLFINLVFKAAAAFCLIVVAADKVCFRICSLGMMRERMKILIRAYLVRIGHFNVLKSDC